MGKEGYKNVGQRITEFRRGAGSFVFPVAAVTASGYGFLKTNLEGGIACALCAAACALVPSKYPFTRYGAFIGVTAGLTGHPLVAGIAGAGAGVEVLLHYIHKQGWREQGRQADDEDGGDFHGH